MAIGGFVTDIKTDPGFGMYHARDRNSVIMLRKPALQRLINQRLKDRSRPSDIVHVPVLIRFLIPDSNIPKPPSSSAAYSSARESRSRSSRRGPPSVIDTSEHVDNRGSPGGPPFVFIRKYYTPTIPGIIISHAAISKQLGTDGYNMSSFAEGAGHILFPHRLRRA